MSNVDTRTAATMTTAPVFGYLAGEGTRCLVRTHSQPTMVTDSPPREGGSDGGEQDGETAGVVRSPPRDVVRI